MAVNKTVVVISTLVDSTVREYQPDVDFILFHLVSISKQHQLEQRRCT